jgi:phosphoglycolate phosphatase-like HAD superfamily hydrolase
MTKFILFDIDHTLIYSGGAGVVALNRTMEELTGIAQGFQGINCAGKTDAQILREAMIKHRLDSSEGDMVRFLRRYVEHLNLAMDEITGHVKPGIQELLNELSRENGFVLGLLTGNIEEGARIKLGRFGLNEFFSVGAFGSDSEYRNDLLPIAVDRLAREHGVKVAFKDCLVIGDTPLDVECAKVHGAGSLAVATGPYALEILNETEPELALPDLSDTREVMAWLLNWARNGALLTV